MMDHVIVFYFDYDQLNGDDKEDDKKLIIYTCSNIAHIKLNQILDKWGS